MKKNLAWALILSLLPACQQTELQLASAPLETFGTQALTQSYLERKLNHWIHTNNSSALGRELKYGCWKHQSLLQQIFNAFPVLYTNVENVMAGQVAQDPSLELCLDELASSFPGSGEFQVNTWITGSQLAPSIAVNKQTGDFVIVWVSNNQVGGTSAGDIYAQRFNSSGVPQGSEFRVNTWTTDSQTYPKIAMDQAGNFVVAWQSINQVGGSAEDIYAQRFNHLGVPQGSEFRVNSWITGEQKSHDLAMDPAGNFVVTWQSSNQAGGSSAGDIYAQRFNSLGAPQGSEFRVNTWITQEQILPEIAMVQTGHFMVTWHSLNQAGGSSSWDIYAQRFNHLGAPQASEFRVNSWTTGEQHSQAIGGDQAGNFVVAWASNNQAGGSSSWDIYAQRFNSLGALQGSEFRVNSWTTNEQYDPTIGLDQSGNFVIAWRSLQQAVGGNFNIYAQRFNAAGLSQDSEFRVNTSLDRSHYAPAIGMEPTGNFVVTWGSGEVYAQRYNSTGVPQ